MCYCKHCTSSLLADETKCMPVLSSPHPKAVFMPNQYEKWSGQDDWRKQGISYVCQHCWTVEIITGEENWLSRSYIRRQQFTSALTDSASSCWVGVFVNAVMILLTAKCLLFVISCTTYILCCLSLWWLSFWPSLKFFQLLLTQMLRVWCLLYWAEEGLVKPRWTSMYSA